MQVINDIVWRRIAGTILCLPLGFTITQHELKMGGNRMTTCNYSPNESQDILIKFPNFSRVSLTIGHSSWLFLHKNHFIDVWLGPKYPFVFQDTLERKLNQIKWIDSTTHFNIVFCLTEWNNWKNKFCWD